MDHNDTNKLLYCTLSSIAVDIIVDNIYIINSIINIVISNIKGECHMTTQNIRILRLPDVKQLTGLSRSTIYAMMKEGSFPKNIPLGVRSVGWKESEVIHWIESRLNLSKVS